FAYVTNFGDGTVSCYEITAGRSLKLHEPVAGSARQGEKGLRDEAISGDGRYLYAIDPDAQKLFGWAVGQGGQPTPVGEVGGGPADSPGRGLDQAVPGRRLHRPTPPLASIYPGILWPTSMRWSSGPRM